MNGKHIVKVSDKRVRYSFEVVRNITNAAGQEAPTSISWELARFSGVL